MFEEAAVGAGRCEVPLGMKNETSSLHPAEHKPDRALRLRRSKWQAPGKASDTRSEQGSGPG